MRKFTDADFSKEVENSKKIVLVDFWADWCGPCHMIAPILEEVDSEFASNDNVEIGKLNVDENPRIAGKYGVMSIPTLIIFKDGLPAASIVGVQPKDKIISEIKNFL